MANVKSYLVEKEINGKKYVAQWAGLSVALQSHDDCYIPGTGNISLEKRAKYLFDNVVVEPAGLTVDDFETLEELTAVTEFANDVMNGEFRDKAKTK